MSHRQVRADGGFIHLALPAAQHDFAALHDDIGCGKVAKPVIRFSRTDSRGKISRPCGTMASPARARSCGARAEISLSSQAILPERIGFSPKIARNRLVFPTPLRPRMQVTSPLRAA